MLDQPTSERPSEAHLLNVQDYPIVYSEYLTSSMTRAIRDAQIQQSPKVPDMAAEVVRGHIVVGLPDHAVVEQAALLGCEQIVMRTRGLGSIKSIVLGSVAQRVVHLAPVPGALVKQPPP